MTEFVFTSDEIDAVLQRVDNIVPPLTDRERVVLLAMIDAAAEAARVAVGQDATSRIELDETEQEQQGRVILADAELRTLVDEFHTTFGQGPDPIVTCIKIGPGFPCP